MDIRSLHCNRQGQRSELAACTQRADLHGHAAVFAERGRTRRHSEACANRSCSVRRLMSPSLIGRLGSSAFRLSTTAVSMSLTGSRFSPDLAPGPLYGAFLVKKFKQG